MLVYPASLRLDSRPPLAEEGLGGGDLLKLLDASTFPGGAPTACLGRGRPRPLGAVFHSTSASVCCTPARRARSVSANHSAKRAKRGAQKAATRGEPDSSSSAAWASATSSAQMPGVVRQVFVSEGEAVEAGQALLLLEAMKMEIRVSAPAAGTVRRLMVRAGDTVERGQTLAEVE